MQNANASMETTTLACDDVEFGADKNKMGKWATLPCSTSSSGVETEALRRAHGAREDLLIRQRSCVDNIYITTRYMPTRYMPAAGATFDDFT